MRRVLSALFLSAVTLSLFAQAPGSSTTANAPASVRDLPVRKVVLYKNGVGYFEHSGSVHGNQKVSIDFTSSQLNDVLQSLTVLDEGGGKVSAVNYNSTTPIEEQLKLLSLGLDNDPETPAIYAALRGQRVEVAGAGAPLSGRLVNIDSRKLTDKNGNTSEDRYFLIVATDAGALRTAEITDAVSVRMADPSLQKQFAAYLEIVASSQNQQGRHLTLEDRGEGDRRLQVSYISEVPVWKSTYRVVFPREDNGKAIMQGWAVVDNTVGADWDNVQLSLVAGAPQSFIQPLSQPLYVRRAEVPIATQAQLTPQTHEAAQPVVVPAQARGTAMVSKLMSGAAAESLSGDDLQKLEMEGSAAGLGGSLVQGSGSGAGYGHSGGVYVPSTAISDGDVSTKGFDDFFEYALAQPVTIHKNESAMVPILEQELPAQRVTLWSQRAQTPLRAVWLENTSKLTLDAGNFSIFENGEFAGEGLLDPIHPGEKRLLSYAADQAVRVRVTKRDSGRTLHHVEIHKGAIIETHMNVASVTYTATNSGDQQRTVLIEHSRRTNGWSLADGIKADETAPDLYRFKVPVAAHATADLEVREHGPEVMRVDLNANQNQIVYLLDLVKRVPSALDTLKPVIDAQEAVANLENNIAQSKQSEDTAAADEARARDNVTALKGNDAAKRFVDEMNRAEDTLQAARKQTADLEKQKETAVEKLHDTIAALSFDWDETAVK
jgi:hypothetical protein